ncbi:MAG: ArnT family glycosyltransferase [Anaerolineales bacterium]
MSRVVIPQKKLPSQNQLPSKKNTKKQRIAVWLFILGLILYLATRLIRLPDFPIYFFTDEAIQTQQAADLIKYAYNDAQGVFLPTYFENGGQYNLSFSVYAQVLPTLLLGKSVWVTRGVSVMLTLVAAISLGLYLRDGLHSTYWWLGPLLLTMAPTWFLHSRTAFETVLMTSMYAGFLYFYIRYRQGHAPSLLIALTFGALAFYAYSPGQVIMVVTGIALLIVDSRYHWQNRKISLLGLGLLILLSLPFLRFSLTEGQERFQHLIVLNSYWVKPIPLYEKILNYFTRYLKGFNPFYWFWPNPSFIQSLWPQVRLPSWLFSNQLDLDRHTMRGYGHLLWVTFPFWVSGWVICVRRFKDPAYRTLILATLAAPSGAAIVDWGITRGMVFIIPTLIITAVGLNSAFVWLEEKFSKIRYAHIAAMTFAIGTFFSTWMLGDALINGPTWYDDYGLAGMQYGGRQVFTRAVEIAQSEPETTVLVSSTWANGPDVVMRYFTDDLPNVRMGNINAFTERFQPLDRNLLFVMAEEDLRFIEESEKFTNVTVEETIPYPDGRVGFYFVRLEYVKNIKAILEAERIARQKLLIETVTINGQAVEVHYPTLDMNEIGHIFDGDPTTLIRTLEANPLRLILNFEKPIQLHKITVIVGGTPTKVTATAFADGQELESSLAQVDSALVNRNMGLPFKENLTADTLNIEVLNPHDGEIAHVHLWEVIIE